MLGISGRPRHGERFHVSGTLGASIAQLATPEDEMTLKSVYSPYTLRGLEQDMVYGPNFKAHVALKEGINVNCLAGGTTW